MSKQRKVDGRKCEWVAENLKMLQESHIAPLIKYVDDLRASFPLRQIPYFDTRYGGVRGRVLLLKEAPGPTAIASGFVAPENKGQTAKNLRILREDAPLARGYVVNWNIVPWYIGNTDGTKIAPPTRVQVAEGISCLPALLRLLPDLRVVILMGTKAKKGWKAACLAGCEHLEILETWHPSPVALNRNPDYRPHILDTLIRANKLAMAEW